MFRVRASMVLTAICLSILVGFATAAESTASSLPIKVPAEAAAAPTTNGASVEKSPEDEALEAMRKEQQKLQAEYQLLMQRQKNALIELELQKQELAAEAALREAREKKHLTTLRTDAERLKAEQALRQAELEQQLGDMQAELKRLSTMNQLQSARRAEELAGMKATAEQLTAENKLLTEQTKRARLESDSSMQEYQIAIGRLQRQMELRSAKDVAAARVLADIKHPTSPFVDGTLYISDRRIDLNGPIFGGTADYVCDRIHYFNNQSREAPIFIVIDNSPGGSVMEGYRIVKAIESSQAPVHIVVKSFAASMAAVITTLADQSYAYPNAIILHHQMSGGMYGNLTQQEEQLENAKEWSRRLAEPVARKMGVSLDRFVELMYENNSDGDWEEFANEALKRKWITHVVQEIRETGIREQPTSSRWSIMPFFFEAEQTDADGHRFVKLPRLGPFDYYFMYDPDNYYRE